MSEDHDSETGRDEDLFLTSSEISKMGAAVTGYKGGLTAFAKDAKISDLAIARACAGWKCQRGSIALMRGYLTAH